MVNKKKRNHPDVEEIIARPWCYYCERDFDDDRVLTQHQKAKHFKCDHCNRRLNTAGGLAVHLQQVHKATLTAVENAIEGRQNVDPEIFGMCGIPQELLDAHRQRILNEYFKQQADRRAQTGNPPPGQGQPNAKKQRTMETKEELKARAAEHRAKRAAEREAAAKEGKTVQKSSSTTPDLAQARPTPTASDYMAPPPQTSYDHSYYDRPQQLPLFAPPYVGVPVQSPHGPGFPPSFPVQQPGQWPSHMPPHSFSPPQAAPYATPSYTLPVHTPAASRMPSMTASSSHITRAPHITRQPAVLQPAPGLPARPSFDLPSFNREDMQRMHTGQAPPPASTAGHPRNATKPRKLSAQEQEMEDVEKMLQDLKKDFKQQQALDAAANASQQVVNLVSDTQTGPPDVPAPMAPTAPENGSNATQEAANTVPGTQTGPPDVPAPERIYRVEHGLVVGRRVDDLDFPEDAVIVVPAPGGVYVPAVAPAVAPAADPPTRQRRPNVLAYDHHDESPEEKLAKRSKYAFERNDA